MRPRTLKAGCGRARLAHGKVLEQLEWRFQLLPGSESGPWHATEARMWAAAPPGRRRDHASRCGSIRYCRDVPEDIFLHHMFTPGQL